MTFEEWYREEFNSEGTYRDWLQMAWDAAVAAERERCAAIADSYDDFPDDGQRGSDGGVIAAEIRKGT